MSTNLVQSLRDSAEILSIPEWIRKEFTRAADRIEELEDEVDRLTYLINER